MIRYHQCQCYYVATVTEKQLAMCAALKTLVCLKVI